MYYKRTLGYILSFISISFCGCNPPSRSSKSLQILPGNNGPLTKDEYQNRIYEKEQQILEEERRWYKRRNELMIAQEYDQMIKEAGDLSDTKLFHLCYQLVNFDLYEAGIRCYDKCIPTNLDFPDGLEECYRKRGYCYWKLGHLEKAIADYKTAIDTFYRTKAAVDFFELLVQAKMFDETEAVIENLDQEEFFKYYYVYFRQEYFDRFKNACMNVPQMEKVLRRIEKLEEKWKKVREKEEKKRAAKLGGTNELEEDEEPNETEREKRKSESSATEEREQKIRIKIKE